MFPYLVPVEQLKAAKQRSGVQHVLMNAIPGKDQLLNMLYCTLELTT